MAGLSDRRGQILLIGGLLLAVSIIALAVVFNAAVGTSTLAGQAEQDVSERPIRAIQEDVRASVTDLMERAIEAHPRNRTAQIEYVRSNISTINREVQRYATGSEQLVSVSWNGTTAEDGTFNSTYAKPSSGSLKGWHISNTTGDFRSPNGSNPYAKDWAIGSGSRFRNFELNATDLDHSTGGDHFTIEFSGDGGQTYSVYFRQTNATAISPDVEVEGPNGSRGRCEWDLNPAGSPFYLDVDFTNATLNDEYCTSIDFFSHLETPYSVRFVNATKADGSFSLTTTDGTFRENLTASKSLNYTTSPEPRWPGDWYRRLYGVMLDLEYYGPQVEYNTTIAVTPGEL